MAEVRKRGIDPGDGEVGHSKTGPPYRYWSWRYQKQHNVTLDEDALKDAEERYWKAKEAEAEEMADDKRKRSADAEADADAKAKPDPDHHPEAGPPYNYWSWRYRKFSHDHPKGIVDDDELEDAEERYWKAQKEFAEEMGDKIKRRDFDEDDQEEAQERYWEMKEEAAEEMDDKKLKLKHKHKNKRSAEPHDHRVYDLVPPYGYWNWRDHKDVALDDEELKEAEKKYWKAKEKEAEIMADD